MTGGAGFIGSHVVDRLLASGHEVAIVDNLSTGARANVNAGARLHVADVRAPELLRIVDATRPDAVVHLAAQAAVSRSVADPGFDASVNILGMLNLLEACRSANVRNVVYISTGGAAYGDTDVVPTPETHLTRPASPYGVSKVAAELYLDCWAGLHAARGVSLRLANVYGPRQDPRRRGRRRRHLHSATAERALVRDQRRRRADARLHLRGRRRRRRLRALTRVAATGRHQRRHQPGDERERALPRCWPRLAGRRPAGRVRPGPARRAAAQRPGLGPGPAAAGMGADDPARPGAGGDGGVVEVERRLRGGARRPTRRDVRAKRHREAAGRSARIRHMTQRRALITGITGQDGSYLAELLLERATTSTAWSAAPRTENFERIAHLRDRITLHQGDLLDQLSLIDAAAASRSPTRSTTSPRSPSCRPLEPAGADRRVHGARRHADARGDPPRRPEDPLLPGVVVARCSARSARCRRHEKTPFYPR